MRLRSRSSFSLVGPVRILHSEVSSNRIAADGWDPEQRVTEATFRPDGLLLESRETGPRGMRALHETRLYDGSARLVDLRVAGVSPLRRTFTYDRNGRLVRIVRIAEDGAETVAETSVYDAAGHRIAVAPLEPVPLGAAVEFVRDSLLDEDSEDMIVVPGATTRTTTYDAKDRPLESVFHSASHELLNTTTWTRDQGGRLLIMESHPKFASPFSNGINPELSNMSPEERRRLEAQLQAFAPMLVSALKCEYDGKGRLVTRIRQTGMDTTDRVTFVYDDHDNVIEARTESRSPVVSSQQPAYTGSVRFELTYDARGNWTERTASLTSQHVEVGLTNRERRTLTYYPS